MTITMSALPRLLNCDGSLVLPRADVASPWADQGNDEHEDLARQVQTGTLPPRLARIVPAGSRAEVKVAFDVLTGQGRIIGEGGGRDYGTPGPFEIVGSIDVLGVEGDTLIVVDWKTGHKEVDPASRNWQLWGYAIAAARALGLSKAIVRIAYTNLPGQPIDEHALDSFDLAEFATRLAGLHVREGRLRHAYKEGVTPETREGTWCKHCASKSRCPSKVGLLVQVSTKGLATIGDTALTPERAREAHLEIERLDQLVVEAKARRSQYIDEHGPIDLGNGKLYGRVPRSGPRQLDGSIAVQAIREVVGESSKEFEALAVERKTSQAAIERAAKALGVPGISPAKLKERIVKRIDELGGVTRGKDQMPLGEFPKPEGYGGETKALDVEALDALLDKAG